VQRVPFGFPGPGVTIHSGVVPLGSLLGGWAGPRGHCSVGLAEMGNEPCEGCAGTNRGEIAVEPHRIQRRHFDKEPMGGREPGRTVPATAHCQRDAVSPREQTASPTSRLRSEDRTAAGVGLPKRGTNGSSKDGNPASPARRSRPAVDLCSSSQGTTGPQFRSHKALEIMPGPCRIVDEAILKAAASWLCRVASPSSPYR